MIYIYDDICGRGVVDHSWIVRFLGIFVNRRVSEMVFSWLLERSVRNIPEYSEYPTLQFRDHANEEARLSVTCIRVTVLLVGGTASRRARAVGPY